MKKTQKFYARLDRYDKKRYSAKRKKLREELLISEKKLVLAERIKNKAAPGKFYKQSVQNISYFDKDRTYRRYKKLLTKRCSKQQKTSKKISKN